MKKEYKFACEITYTVVAESEEEAKEAVLRDRKHILSSQRSQIEPIEEIVTPTDWTGCKLISVTEPPKCEFQTCVYGGYFKGEARKKLRKAIRLSEKAEDCDWYEEGRCTKGFPPLDYKAVIEKLIDSFSLILASEGFTYKRIRKIIYYRIGDEEIIDELLPKVLQKMVDEGALEFVDGKYYYTSV